MAAFTRWILGHKLIVILFWVAVTLFAFATVQRATNALSFDFSAPGEEGYETNVTIARTYGLDETSFPLVLVASLPSGQTIDSPQVRQQFGAAVERVATALPQARIVSFLSTGDRTFVSQDGRTTYALISTPASDIPTGFGPSPALTAVQGAVKGLTVGGAPLHVTGIVPLSSSEGGQGPSVLVEVLIGGIGALVVLIFVFGTFISIAPLIMALVAIPNTFLLVWALTTVTDISFIVEFLIALIGLGVAIDYALLIVMRWREERAAGYDNAVAVERAMATAGHAVVFSGTAVAIGLLAMVTLPIPALRSMGYGGMLIPLVSVAVALTLLPVILATIGPRLDWPRRRSEAHLSRPWSRWAHVIVQRRWVALVVALVLLGVLLIPALRLNPGDPSANSLSKSGDAHDGLVALEQSGIGTGPLTPIEVLLTGGDPASVATRLKQVDGVRTVVPPIGPAGKPANVALISVIPATDANSSAGRAILSRVKRAAHNGSSQVGVGGAAASSRDFTDAIYGDFPLMIAVLAVITFLLLARAFRSVVLPIKAVLLDVISIGAAWGILSLVWQSGYGSNQIWGIPATGATTAWVPFMVFAFLFGLSMDYEVFIVSRIREEYDRTGDTDASIVEGIGRTGRLVTFGALILFLSFVSLSTTPSNDVKVLATGLAAGILLDATVVRALLVPAAVSLMGRWNWWLPVPLARLLRVAPSSATAPVPVAVGSDD
jgi:putative drug exporter of the RND superfamily